MTDVEFLPKQLSEQKREQMRAQLQAVVDSPPDPQAEAVVFAFGLCHGGVPGIRARDKPLIVPRAHDCVTLLFGDKNRFLEFSRAHPDTRYQSSGMIERGFTDEDMEQRAFRELGLNRTYTD